MRGEAGDSLLDQVHGAAGDTRFLGGEGNQVAMHRRVEPGGQRRAWRAGHLVVKRIHQTGIAAPVQFVVAVFSLHSIANRLAFMRDEDRMGAEMVAVSLAALEDALRASLRPVFRSGTVTSTIAS